MSPYLGLTPYSEGDSEGFFGREDEVDTCIDRLRTISLLAVVGPSGSGKSSLLRAGLAPALRRDGGDVRVISPGRHPLDALTAARPRASSYVLVDQAEEAFSLCSDETERAAFFAALVEHSSRGRVILALRADHTGDLAQQPGLAVLVERGLYLLGPMSPDALRAAIEGPARQHGLVLEAGLVDLLIREVEGESGALPLLSHALRETWLRHEGRTLTVAGYQSSGGIRGAVAQSAEELYARVGEGEQAQLRELVLRLVVPGPEGEPVRGRVPKHQVVVAPAQEHLVDLMVAARLVTSDDGVIELAHEAVVRAWPRLRGWLEDDVAGQRMRHRLTQATEDWVALGRQDSELYRGARLATVHEWVEGTHPQLTHDELRFLDSSSRLAAAEEESAVMLARSRGTMVRRLRLALGGATILLVLALVAGFLAVHQARRADQSSLTADARRIGARALVTTDISRSLLMAVAGARLDPSPETQANLDAALAQHPELVDTVTAPSTGRLSSVAASPDGRRIAVTDNAHHVWTYDARTLTPVADTQIGRDTTANYDTPLAYNPAGDVLAVGGPPGSGRLVHLLDADTLQPLPDQLGGWPGRWAQVVGVAFTPDGRYLTASLDVSPRGDPRANPVSGAALIWKPAKPRLPLVQRIRLPVAHFSHSDVTPYYDHLALSPDGATLYGALPLAAYGVRSGDTRYVRDRFSAVLALDPSGDLLAGTFDSPTDITLIDARTGHRVHTLRGLTGDVNQVTFSDDGKMVAATGRDGKLLVWDAENGDVLHDIDDGAQFATGLDFSPDGRRILSISPDSHEIHLWDLSGARSALQRLPIEHPLEVAGTFIRPSPSADAVAVTVRTESGTELRIVDVATGTRSRSLVPRTSPWSGAGSWSPDDRQYAVGYGDGRVAVVERDTGRVLTEKRVVDGYIIAVRHTADGERLAVLTDHGHVQLVDAHSLQPVGHPVVLGRQQTWDVSMAPDNHTAFVVGAQLHHGVGWDSPTDRWWTVDLARGKVVARGDLSVNALYTDFSPQGDRVAISAVGGEVELLDPTTGDAVRSPVTGHDGDVYWVTFDRDGSRFATASNAGDVAVWDGRTGQLVSSTKVPGEEISTVAGFRPDGTLTVASFTGEVYHWDPSLAHAVSFACAVAGRDLTRAEWTEELPGRPYRSVCPAGG